MPVAEADIICSNLSFLNISLFKVFIESVRDDKISFLFFLDQKEKIFFPDKFIITLTPLILSKSTIFSFGFHLKNFKFFLLFLPFKFLVRILI